MFKINIDFQYHYGFVVINMVTNWLELMRYVIMLLVMNIISSIGKVKNYDLIGR
jgi:hypothetical protein